MNTKITFLGKSLVFLSCLSLMIVAGFGQNALHKSIHQEQSEYYNSLGIDADSYQQLNKPAAGSATKGRATCNLKKTVYGWHPYWQNGMQTNYQWNLLSHLSYFSYEVDPATGNASSTHSFATAQVVTDALNAGVKVTLCVTLFSSHTTFFGSSIAKQTLITNLINLVSARGAHGVNIDFEGMGSSHKTAFTAFMIDLSNQMHAAIPGSEVSIALYSVDWSSIFELAAMKDYVDQFIIMGYDYYYSGSTTAGPNDPLFNFSTGYNYDLSKSVTFYLSAGCPNSQLILGLPWYGREYGAVSSAVGAAVNNAPNSSSRTYSYVRNNASGNYSAANNFFEKNSYSNGYIFNNGTEWRHCYINDAYALGRRMDLVNQRDIGGIGIWALGYDDGFSEYWQAIEDHFTDCATVACTDSISDMGGPNRNYYDKENYSYTISPTGASRVSLVFSQFDLETNYDSLWLYDGASTSATLIGSYTGTNSPGTITSTGPSITLRFKSDNATVKPGFKAVWTCLADQTAPTTAINTTGGNWKTASFTANFTDVDSQSGIEKGYYQVADFDGSEWRCNSQRGFFNDDFNTTNLNSEWTDSAGTWTITGSALTQTDAANGNTNLFAPLTQNLSNRYMYHWKGKFTGTGSNKRSGLHFFCDDARLSNRGNSYFVYFRENDNKVQLYKVSNNVFSLVKNDTLVIDPNVTYDYKVIFDRITGKMLVYADNVLVTSYTDATPYSNGSYVSFRTGNCTYTFDDFRVYRSRTSSTAITVGTGTSSDDVRYQNPWPAQKACIIRSVAQDSSDNISTVATDSMNVDWTAPDLSGIYDGTTADIDTSMDPFNADANWLPAADVNSGIVKYMYSLSTTPGGADIINWTNYNTSTGVNMSGLTLMQGIVYYFNLRAENGAGLISSIGSTDGFIIDFPTSTALIAKDFSCVLFPNPTEGEFVIIVNQSLTDASYTLLDMYGCIVLNEKISESTAGKVRVSMKDLPSGIYTLQMNSNNEKVFTQKVILQR